MLKGYKTYIMAGVAVVTAIASYLVGEIDIATAGQLTLTALLGASVRQGIKTEVGKKMMLGMLCFGLVFSFTIREAQASPLFLLFSTAITGGWATATYVDCKAEGVDFEDCVKKTVKERQPLDYSKLND